MKLKYVILLIFCFSFINASTFVFGGTAIEINQANYSHDTYTLDIQGANFDTFGTPSVSIGDSLLLDACTIQSSTNIVCNIISTPAISGGTFPVRITAGNSPHTNAKIDVFIPPPVQVSQCTPGDMILCYPDSPATINVGECQSGYRICYDDGTWGKCQGAVTPIAEVCDNLDNDCDGVTDEEAVDAQIYFYDYDNDGYGLTSNSIRSCEVQNGYVINEGDCDDNNLNAYPGAQEICGNDIDENCNGVLDSNCLYPDVDGDGYGSDVDCNDNNSLVNPGYSGGHQHSPWTNSLTEERSFDYNCDGEESRYYGDQTYSYEFSLSCVLISEGWYGSVPECGEGGIWATGIEYKLGEGCIPTATYSRVEWCR